jgi:Tat protein translocase TatB subunit
MPQIGPMEILVVGVIALIVFGPQKLPEIARSIGRAASELRRMASDVRDEFEAGINLEDREEKHEDKEEQNEAEGGDPAPKAGDPAPKAGDPAPKAGDPAPKAGDPAPKAEDGDPSSNADEAATSTAAQTNKVVGPARDEGPPER